MRVFRFGLMASAFLGYPAVLAEAAQGMPARRSRHKSHANLAGPRCKMGESYEWAEKSGLKVQSKSDAQIKTQAASNYDNPLLVVIPTFQTSNL